MLTLKQLKGIKFNLGPTNKCGSSSCPITVSLYDALNSFFSTGAANIITDNTLSGKGSLTFPLKVAQQSATSGQVLTWNGTTWAPANPVGGSQTLTLVGDLITLSAGGGNIPVEDLVSLDVLNAVTVGTDGLLYVPQVTGTLPVASIAGQIVYWTGLAYANALEYVNNQEPPAGTTDVNLPHTPIASLPVKVFLNGVLKRNTVDYTILANTITFNYVFATNDKVTTFYYN